MEKQLPSKGILGELRLFIEKEYAEALIDYSDCAQIFGARR
jgi:hypothetical protein